MARQDHPSPERVIADAVEFYHRQRILDETNRAYTALRADLVSSAAFGVECASMNGTLADGITDGTYPL